MSDPISAAFAFAATALSATGSIAAGKAQAAQYAAQAALQRQEAERSRQMAAVQETLSRRQGDKELGRQRAILASRGVDITAGSPLLVLADTAGEIEFNILLQRANAEAGAVRQDQAAQFSVLKAGAARKNAALSAGTTLLSGASDFAKSNVAKKLFGD